MSRDSMMMEMNPYQRIGELLRSSKHLVAFTGAGISTSTGLPDYRGEKGIRKRKKQRDTPLPSLRDLIPSPTHLGLVELYKLGLLKYVVTQNIDDLHSKSGIPKEILLELHGNAMHWQCDTCQKMYHQQDLPEDHLCLDTSCPSSTKSKFQRLRTRKGNGILKRQVVRFSDEVDIRDGLFHCEQADVALILGTSLRVEPFATMAYHYAKHVIIINLQKTIPQADKKAIATGVRLYEPCDHAFSQIMKEIHGKQYTIPLWNNEIQQPLHSTENKNYITTKDAAVVVSTSVVSTSAVSTSAVSTSVVPTNAVPTSVDKNIKEEPNKNGKSSNNRNHITKTSKDISRSTDDLMDVLCGRRI